ncbi:PucR family transcriptional regulator [Lysinibacillus sp. LZ02]|uniref:PucR family transcriptional regulator n=1 Tax=Lysinibacillus sp. LZ02 TaxID=3420668 RepID=UPI003D360A1A
MATVSQMMQSSLFPQLQLIAGESGIYRRVNGINIVEKEELTMFCRPNELVVTTGVLIANDINALQRLIRQTFNKRTAGFIINIGPYIPQIPDCIIQFANEQEYPLFQMEWEHRVTDLLKATFQFITTNQQERSLEEQAMNQLLFSYQHHVTHLSETLERLNFPKHAEYGIIVCATRSEATNIRRYATFVLTAFQQRYEHFIHFQYRNQLIYLIDRTSVKTINIPFSQTVTSIYNRIEKKYGELDVIIGMGSFYTALEKIHKSYEEALTVIQLANLHNNQYLYKYKDIGAYQIIMGIDNPILLENFHQEMLGRLYRYDELNNTDFILFLRIYLEENGSTNRISQRTFIHRNTVLYKVNKIETLLDINLNNTFTKTNLYLAFLIEDVLKHRM